MAGQHAAIDQLAWGTATSTETTIYAGDATKKTAIKSIIAHVNPNSAVDQVVEIWLTDATAVTSNENRLLSPTYPPDETAEMLLNPIILAVDQKLVVKTTTADGVNLLISGALIADFA